MPTLEAAAYAEITEALAHLAHDAGRLTRADPAWERKHASIDKLLDHLDTLERV